MPRSDRFLITGCASGIGKHLADELLKRGHQVLATDIDLDTLCSHAEAVRWPQDRARAAKLDVRDPAAWDAAIGLVTGTWGGLDVALNVAGYIRPGRAQNVEVEDVDRHFDINVKGVVFGTRAAARVMIEQGGGHIINIASLASLAPVPGISLYSASKYAVRAFSLAAAEDLLRHNIAVTVVCPDAVATPMLDKQLSYSEAALTFTGRVLTVEDLSQLILGRVLKKRPLLVALPRWRGWLARIGDLSPRMARSLASIMRKQGLLKQKRIRDKA